MVKKPYGLSNKNRLQEAMCANTEIHFLINAK